MNQSQKRVKNLIFSNIDGIYNSCKEVAKAWDSNTISIVYLKEVVKKSRPNNLDDREDFKEFLIAYDHTMETMCIICENKAKAMDKNSIPLKYLKECLDRIKRSFEKGLKR